MFTSVRIIGHSMSPALRSGEAWVVWRTTRIRPGDVIMLRHPVRPDLNLVKRAISQRATGDWWVEGDNRDFSEDSRTFGYAPSANILGRVLLRYSPIVRGALV